jgi:hypothetical protein
MCIVVANIRVRGRTKYSVEGWAERAEQCVRTKEIGNKVETKVQYKIMLPCYVCYLL